MAETTTNALQLPEQDLARYEHFDLQPPAAVAWVEGLPTGSPGRAAALLRTALADLNRVVLPPQTRFALLEVLRLPLYQVRSALMRGFLGDSTRISEQMQAQAGLISDLCELGAAGYALVAVHTIRKPDAIEDTNPARLACEALQRAIAFRSEGLLQAHLLYQPAPLNHWAILHRLYALAERQQLAGLPVTDPVSGAEVTIAGEYLPGLLIACCRTNQLRQKEIIDCFRLLRHWQQLAHLEDPTVGSGLFVVDLASDRPPTFGSMMHDPPGASQRFLNTRDLLERINELRQRSGDGELVIDGELRLDAHLGPHLTRSLGEVSQRHFKRRPVRHQLWIATGLTNVHYFVAGERSLEQVLHGDDHEPASLERMNSNPFLRSSDGGDVWQQANPEEIVDNATISESGIGIPYPAAGDPASPPQRHTVFTVESSNVSAGGYCVEWAGLPDGINIGDVVCLSEREDGDGHWSIAVIRWLSQVKDAPTLLGLELLSPGGTAYAGQVRLADGSHSGPIRVLLLPEIPLVGQPHTLLAPRLVFKEDQKIILTRKGESMLIKLRRRLATTAAFGQFDLEYRRQLNEDVEGSRDALHANRFESVWDEL
jgi:hypothetical protein